MTVTRKQAAAALANEIGQRRLALDTATDEAERAFRSADLVILFLDNLEFIKHYLAGNPIGVGEITIRTLRDRLQPGN